MTLFDEYYKEAFKEINKPKYYFYTYGSLMRGLHNHHILQSNNAKYIKTLTIKGFTLYDLGNFPGALKTNDNNKLIVEKYFINYDNIEELDFLEGVEFHYYKREIIRDSDNDLGFIYICHPDLTEGRDIIRDGNWRKHFIKQEKIGNKKRSNEN